MKKNLRILLALSLATMLAFTTVAPAFAGTGDNGGNNCRSIEVEVGDTFFCLVGGTSIFGIDLSNDGTSFMKLRPNTSVVDGYQSLGAGVEINTDFYGNAIVCFRIPPGQASNGVFIQVNYGEFGTALISPNITTPGGGHVTFACAQVWFTPEISPVVTLVVQN